MFTCIDSFAFLVQIPRNGINIIINMTTAVLPILVIIWNCSKFLKLCLTFGIYKINKRIFISKYIMEYYEHASNKQIHTTLP